MISVSYTGKNLFEQDLTFTAGLDIIQLYLGKMTVAIKI